MTATAQIDAAERRLTTPEDFPRVAVYERAGAAGPIYKIAFSNPEYGGAYQILWRFMALLLITLLISGVLAAGIVAERMGVPWYAGIGAFGVLGALVYHQGYRPHHIPRAIELDKAADCLRVLRKGRTVLTRPLSRMVNVTVADHPETEDARMVRQQNGRKTLTDVEKQHCLIGWFGPGGGEQVVLLSRAEWPKRNSLFEVRQAFIWAKQQADRTGSNAGRAPLDDLNPPLH